MHKNACMRMLNPQIPDTSRDGRARARRSIDGTRRRGDDEDEDDVDAIETRRRAGVDAVGGVFGDVRARGGGARGDDGGGTDRPLRGE